VAVAVAVHPAAPAGHGEAVAGEAVMQGTPTPHAEPVPVGVPGSEAKGLTDAWPVTDGGELRLASGWVDDAGPPPAALRPRMSPPATPSRSTPPPISLMGRRQRP